MIGKERSGAGSGSGRRGYKGLFPPRAAPASRAYCILCSFSGGILLVTAGSVFCHVISRHPESGGRPMHTPPLALAVSFIVAGSAMVAASVVATVRCGVDDGVEDMEEESQYFCSEDQLDQLYQQNLQQQIIIQRLIEEQVIKEKQQQQVKCACYSNAPGPAAVPSNTSCNTSTNRYVGTTCKGCKCLAQSDMVCCGSRDMVQCNAFTDKSHKKNWLCAAEDCPSRKGNSTNMGCSSNVSGQVNCCNNSSLNSKCTLIESHYCNMSCAESNAAPKLELPASLKCSKHSLNCREGKSSKSLSCSPTSSPVDLISSLRQVKPKPLTASSQISPVLKIQSPFMSKTSTPPMASKSKKQHSEGSNASSPLNQSNGIHKNKQHKMPSKIIATSDEICVVIDSS